LESVPELESILFLFFEEPDLEVDSTYSGFYLCGTGTEIFCFGFF
jgi:hypothetical protein